MNYIFLADGFEEIEAVSVIDIMRRSSLNIKTVSVTGDKLVKGAHGISLIADITFDEIDGYGDTVTSIILPGGMPGAVNLNEFTPLTEMIKNNSETTLLAAICAAPMILGKLGVLTDKKATCYPGFEHHLEGALYTASPIETDSNVITANGPASAFEFGLKIAEYIKSDDSVISVRAGMLLKRSDKTAT